MAHLRPKQLRGQNKDVCTMLHCRCLIAVGTIASASNESKQLAKDLNFHDYIRQVQGQSALDPKLSAVCEELRSLLQ